MGYTVTYGLNANVYAAPHLRIYAEPDYNHRWMPTTTTNELKHHQQQYAPQPYGLSIPGEDFEVEAFTQFQPSTIAHPQHQPHPQFELAPSVKQEEWIQQGDDLHIEPMNFSYPTMSYNIHSPKLYATDFHGAASSALSYDSLEDINFWSQVDFQNPLAFDQLAVQALDIDKALESVQPKSPTPGVQMVFPSRSVANPRVMQGFYA
ncbi:hypothetical protein CPB83DRAFT_848954 [Crepidotus variabilis]|uniref:Uncharacterized protein n=1 Tax=Crepidotus variabilis TaxID=179855 RepID=A0A9P6JSY2_9AGAR|nr:hypothetical protein CPB83DRAFT_848954 [Crepidotus variabilis]